ncbi:MAG: hypothetical protein CL676_00770 [Bdellovibrionaceae bacterium]|nr:hypothetical protein [Pseudobdellovibrionaceae bacterium]|tara:strand:- start:1385 stop:2035 length:651 start_codon:yes stop_codon:yes gene_type:complete
MRHLLSGEFIVNRQIFYVLLGLLWTFVLANCSSASKSIQVNSQPAGVEVYMVDTATGQERKVGETPFALLREDIQGLPNDALSLKFQKEGYEVERILVDLPSKNLTGTLSVKMKDSTDWSQAFVDKKASQYLDDVARMTAEVQGAVGSKDLSKAEVKARAMVNRYPNLAVGWSLLGNVLFLQNRKSDALEAYNRSLGIDPTNQETRNVIEKMKGIQ